MCNLTPFRLITCVTSLACVMLATGCGTQTPHPNEINAFDGASFDALTAAHGALSSLRVQVSVSYPKYVPVFNEAALSYAAAYNAYALYRTAPRNSAAAAVAIANLTVSVVALENTFQADFKASPEVVANVRRQAGTLRQRATQQQVTISDILTELEIAAAIARAVPAAEAYAALASIVIQATSQAVAAEAAQVGQPIDLTAVAPVPVI